MKRIASALLLALLCSASGFGVVVTTTPQLLGGSNRNVIQHATINATENVLQLNPGDRARTVQIWSEDTDWYIRTIGEDGVTHDSTTQAKVAKDRVITLEIAKDTTIYFLRQTADGTLNILPVK